MFTATIVNHWSILIGISLVVAVFAVPYQLLVRALRYPATRKEFKNNFRWMLLVPFELLAILSCSRHERVFVVTDLLFASYMSITYVLGLQLMRQGQGGEKTFGKACAILAGVLVVVFGQSLIGFIPSNSRDKWQVGFLIFMTMLVVVSDWNTRKGQSSHASSGAKEL
ncbi:MAG: hypothetical protein JNM18_08285 [Planctomycetaceae bacterium]|nr:hypothetical protein [Planctomycetaceae bacterium]